MSLFQKISDVLMTSLWMLTYTLVLVSTVKRRFPAVSPWTQAFLTPLEVAVAVNCIVNIDRHSIYVVIAYV